MRKFIFAIPFLVVACAPTTDQREVLCEEQVVPRVCQSLEERDDLEVDADLCEEYVAESGYCERAAEESLRLDECAGDIATLEGATNLTQEGLPESCDEIVESVERIAEGDYSEVFEETDGGTQ